MSGRLVALHGFTQTHHHVEPFAHGVARRAGFSTITTPDLPGHGLSSADRLDFAATVTAVAESCGPGTYVGYSMGGRIALGVAMSAPRTVHRLVLIGATAGIDDPAEAAERRRADDDRAARVEADGVDAFLADWMAMPMFAGLPADPDDLVRRRRNTSEGLAHSLRTAGTGAMPPMWDRLHLVGCPTLVLAGERDDKFVALGRRLVSGIDGGTFATVPGAGHAAHLEQPDRTTAIIGDWIGRTPAA